MSKRWILGAAIVAAQAIPAHARAHGASAESTKD